MDCIVHGVTESRTRLSDFHFSCFRLFAHTVSCALKLLLVRLHLLIPEVSAYIVLPSSPT